MTLSVVAEPVLSKPYGWAAEPYLATPIPCPHLSGGRKSVLCRLTLTMTFNTFVH